MLCRLPSAQLPDEERRLPTTKDGHVSGRYVWSPLVLDVRLKEFISPSRYGGRGLRQDSVRLPRGTIQVQDHAFWTVQRWSYVLTVAGHGYGLD